MVQLRICNECGNVYGKKAGMEYAVVCPICHLASHMKVEIE